MEKMTCCNVGLCFKDNLAIELVLAGTGVAFFIGSEAKAFVNHMAYYKKLHQNYPTTVQVAFYLGRKSLAHLCNCFFAVEASLGILKFDCCQTKIG